MAKLQDEKVHLEQLNRQLRMYKEQDSYFMEGEGADGVNSLMEEQRLKFQNIHEKEAQEMSDAAYQTIKTLNEMLEQKKIQLKSKEEQIDKLRQ